MITHTENTATTFHSQRDFIDYCSENDTIQMRAGQSLIVEGTATLLRDLKKVEAQNSFLIESIEEVFSRVLLAPIGKMISVRVREGAISSQVLGERFVLSYSAPWTVHVLPNTKGLPVSYLQLALVHVKQMSLKLAVDHPLTIQLAAPLPQLTLEGFLESLLDVENGAIFGKLRSQLQGTINLYTTIRTIPGRKSVHTVTLKPTGEAGEIAFQIPEKFNSRFSLACHIYQLAWFSVGEGRCLSLPGAWGITPKARPAYAHLCDLSRQHGTALNEAERLMNLFCMYRGFRVTCTPSDGPPIIEVTRDGLVKMQMQSETSVQRHDDYFFLDAAWLADQLMALIKPTLEVRAGTKVVLHGRDVPVDEQSERNQELLLSLVFKILEDAAPTFRTWKLTLPDCDFELKVSDGKLMSVELSSQEAIVIQLLLASPGTVLRRLLEKRSDLSIVRPYIEENNPALYSWVVFQLILHSQVFDCDLDRIQTISWFKKEVQTALSQLNNPNSDIGMAWLTVRSLDQDLEGLKQIAQLTPLEFDRLEKVSDGTPSELALNRFVQCLKGLCSEEIQGGTLLQKALYQELAEDLMDS